MSDITVTIESETAVTATINTGLAGSSGTSGTAGTSGTSPSFPYGCFSHSASLATTSTTAAYPVYFDTDESKSGITHGTSGTASSKVQIDTAGTYLIIVSAIADSTVVNKHIELWLAVDGTNVPRTNTIVQIPTANTEMTLAVSFIYTFTAGQYFELKYRGDDTGVRFLATAAATVPTRPACPSILCTVNRVA